MSGAPPDRQPPHAPALIAAALVGRSLPGQHTAVNNGAAGPVIAPSASATTTSSDGATATATAATSGRCKPTLPGPPPGEPAAAGPAYVLADKGGVLHIGGQGDDRLPPRRGLHGHELCAAVTTNDRCDGAPFG